jgi:predicted outer membrane lipoprotein
MKTLLGVLLVASFACATAMAQTKNDQQQSDQPAASGLSAKIEAPMQSWFQQPTPAKDDKTQAASGRKRRKVEDIFPIPTVLIEGAVYINVGDTLIPWPGGGASGCFDPTGVETTARIERARAEWAKRTKKD